MNQLEYQTAFHPGPFGQNQQPGSSLQSQQAYSQGQRFSTPHQATAPQAFAPAPYPVHAAPNHSRPPQFDDGLVQQAPHPSAAALFAPGQQNPYTSAPFSHSVSATATPTPPLQQQQQQHQHSRALSHSASPQLGNSPYAGTQPQHLQQRKQHTPPTRYPMAAPPLPQTPAQQASANAVPSPQSPRSPGSQAREQRRVDLILDINIQLLQEISTLQAQGHGGATNPQTQQQLKAQGLPDKMASDEFIQCMRRVQANLAYLAQRADPQMGQKAIPGPAHMTPPIHLPRLQAQYDQLRELFPGWSGLDNRMGQSVSSPRNNSMNSMNGMHASQAAAPSA